MQFTSTQHAGPSPPRAQGRRTWYNTPLLTADSSISFRQSAETGDRFTAWSGETARP